MFLDIFLHLYVTTMQETINCALHPQPSQQRPSTIGAVADGARSRLRVGKQGRVEILNQRANKEGGVHVRQSDMQASKFCLVYITMMWR